MYKLLMGHSSASHYALLIGFRADLSLIFWVRGGWKVNHDQYGITSQLNPSPFRFLLLSINLLAGGTLPPASWLMETSFIPQLVSGW